MNDKLSNTDQTIWSINKRILQVKNPETIRF
jgi:hypothetical protein